MIFKEGETKVLLKKLIALGSRLPMNHSLKEIVEREMKLKRAEVNGESH